MGLFVLYVTAERLDEYVLGLYVGLGGVDILAVRTAMAWEREALLPWACCSWAWAAASSASAWFRAAWQAAFWAGVSHCMV